MWHKYHKDSRSNVKSPAKEQPNHGNYLWFLLLLIPVGYVAATRKDSKKK